MGITQSHVNIIKKKLLSLDSPLAKLDVDDEEDDAQQEADAAHGDVGNTQEVVLAAQETRGGEDHALAAAKGVHRVIVLHLQRVHTLGEAILEASHAVVNLAVEFAEGGEGSAAHPHNKVLIFVAVVLGVVA